MKILFSICCVIFTTLVGATEPGTEKFELENGHILFVTDFTYSRNMPYVFYDQAITSLPIAHPDSTIVAKRRLGKIGNNAEVLYSLIAFKDTAGDKVITISGVATSKDRAWAFNTKVDDSSLTQSLLLVLEYLSSLSYNKPLQTD
jgi:hypothetical protein